LFWCFLRLKLSIYVAGSVVLLELMVDCAAEDAQDGFVLWSFSARLRHEKRRSIPSSQPSAPEFSTRFPTASDSNQIAVQDQLPN